MALYKAKVMKADLTAKEVSLFAANKSEAEKVLQKSYPGYEVCELISRQTSAIKLGLCEGRHAIPDVSGYIFPQNFFSESCDMFNFRRMASRVDKTLDGAKNVILYVTGYTPALIAVVKYCSEHKISLMCRHFNRDTGMYVTQEVL